MDVIWALVHRHVRARRRIEQSPLEDAPAVPRHATGYVEDFDESASLYIVDFNEPYGAVLCEPAELKEV